MEEAYRNPLMTSYYHRAVYDGGRLVGYIDSVSNGVTDAYIQDLMIHPDYQRKSIGTDYETYDYSPKRVSYLYDRQLP